MKKMNPIKYILILNLFALSAMASDGGTVGNGGDSVSAEFVLTAQSAAELIKKNSFDHGSGFNINAFLGAIDSTQVNSEENLILSGHEVDAINYPKQSKILVSRSRWMALRAENQTIPRYMLVIHEYLWMSGTDDSDYRVSKQIISKLTIARFNPQKWWEPMNPTNQISFYFEKDGHGCADGNWGMYFNLEKDNEDLETVIAPSCDTSSRRIIKIHKHTKMGASSRGIRGSYHIFDVETFSENHQLIGKLSYEPEWGRCLVSSDSICMQSGRMQIGDISMMFYMLR